MAFVSDGAIPSLYANNDFTFKSYSYLEKEKKREKNDAYIQ